MRHQIDHIDPRWKEGRNYQLICGLDVPSNLEEREESVNKSKNNRFLPWRVVKDELGTVPMNPGDLCLFLIGANIKEDIPGEWVLLEFMGPEWYFHTKGNFGANYPGKRRNLEASRQQGLKHARDKTGVCGRSPEKILADARAGGLIQGPIARDKKTGIHDPANKEICREGSRKGGTKSGKVNGPKTFENKTGIHDPMKAANNRKYMCLETGYISTPGPLTLWQKKRGIDPSRKVELTPEEKAFIFLWDN